MMHVVEFTLWSGSFIAVHEGLGAWDISLAHEMRIYKVWPGGGMRQLERMPYSALSSYVEPESMKTVGEMTEEEIDAKYGIKYIPGGDRPHLRQGKDRTPSYTSLSALRRALEARS